MEPKPKPANNLTYEAASSFVAAINKDGQVTPEKRQRWDVESGYAQMYEHAASGPITLPHLLEVHRMISQNIPTLTLDQKGRISYVPKTFRGTQWEITPFTPPDQIDEELNSYLETYNDALSFKPESPSQAPKVIKGAAHAMVDFMAIHPFADGNGRLSRILADTLLESGGLYNMPHWLPNSLNGLNPRHAFFYMVESARRTGEGLGIDRILEFMTTQQIEAHAEELKRINGTSNLSPEEIKEKQVIREKLQVLWDSKKELKGKIDSVPFVEL